jgi:hypothetical protein
MAQIKELFRNQKKDIYGLAAGAIIESRGLINPPRGAALLASSPNSTADIIGNQIGGVLKGSANRPSDTIFKNNDKFSKPISLTAAGDIRGVIEAGEEYFIKRTPAPDAFFGSTGGSSNLGQLANLARQNVPALSKALKTKLKKKGEPEVKPEPETVYPTDNRFEYFRPAKFEDSNKNISDDKRKYTEYKRNDKGKLQKVDTKTNNYSAVEGKIYPQSKFDQINSDVLTNLYYKDETELKDKLLKNINESDSKQTVVVIKPYGKDYSFVLPGTITGISEDMSPEWVDFKYLGSPFKKYKYNGVERSLKFELKMYYTNQTEKVVMIQKINSLKELTFPYDEIIAIKYEKSKDYSQLAYTGNFFEISIGGMYQKVFGFIDSLGISVEDNVAWVNDKTDKEDKPYPSVVNVSFSMKIIEDHTIVSSTKNTNIKRFKYNLDGISDTVSTFFDEKK